VPLDESGISIATLHCCHRRRNQAQVIDGVNPKGIGLNPTPAPKKDDGLADAGSANPFRLPRLHPDNGSSYRRFPATAGTLALLLSFGYDGHAMNSADPCPGTPPLLERRAFIAGIAGGLLAAPLAAGGQQTGGALYRIAFLSNDSPRTTMCVPDPSDVGFRALRDGLRDLGYMEGIKITIDCRSAEGDYSRLPGLAREGRKRHRAHCPSRLGLARAGPALAASSALRPRFRNHLRSATPLA
jgi:hypothetical protein